jgi:hypothetical protein
MFSYHAEDPAPAVLAGDERKAMAGLIAILMRPDLGALRCS